MEQPTVQYVEVKSGCTSNIANSQEEVNIAGKNSRIPFTGYTQDLMRTDLPNPTTVPIELRGHLRLHPIDRNKVPLDN